MAETMTNMSMQCVCPKCGIRTPLPDGKQCVFRNCPSCGAGLSRIVPEAVAKKPPRRPRAT